MTKTTQQYVLYDRQTGKVFYTGKSRDACQAYALRNKLITAERSATFLHLSWGWMWVDRADRVPAPLVKQEA